MLDLKGYIVNSTSYANGVLTLVGTLTNGGSSRAQTERYTFADLSSQAFTTTSDGNNGTLVTVCFASGTLIRTARGEVAVEVLRVGDRAITASGEARAIRWLGSRTVGCRAHPRPHDAQPVRIRAGAFGLDADGEAIPARELRLSPGHPCLLEPTRTAPAVYSCRSCA